MSESLEGVSCSVTRQNAGTVTNAAAALALAVFGGVKAPARTDSADSTRPFVTLVCASDSHAIGRGAAAAFNVPSVTAPSRAIPAAVFMPGSLNHGTLTPQAERFRKHFETTVNRRWSHRRN